MDNLAVCSSMCLFRKHNAFFLAASLHQILFPIHNRVGLLVALPLSNNFSFTVFIVYGQCGTQQYHVERVRGREKWRKKEHIHKFMHTKHTQQARIHTQVITSRITHTIPCSITQPLTQTHTHTQWYRSMR